MGVGVSVPARLLAGQQRGLRDVDEHGEPAVEQGDLDVLTLAGVVAAAQRGQDRDRGVHAREDVHHRYAHLGRLVGPGDMHEPRFGLADEVVTRSIRWLSIRAEARQRAVDEPGPKGPEVLVSEAQPLDRARTEVLDDHVAASCERQRRLAVGGVLEIERDASLAAIDSYEVGRVRARERRPPPAGLIAGAGLLDLDHLGPQIGQHHRAVRARQHARQIEHAQARERRITRVHLKRDASGSKLGLTMAVRIACRQLAPRVGDLEGNRAASLNAISEAVTHGAEVVVLPELVTSGYVFASRDEAASVSIAADDALFSEWAAEVALVPAGRGVVIGGFCERGDDGRLYNSAAVVDPSGVRAVYRKVHLWDREKLFFEPGDQPPPVLDLPVGRIGVMICYDLEFPEMSRMLALRGAELIAVPTNWPRAEWPEHEHPPEVVIAMATARTNRLFIACCDRTGTERGQRWTAGTSIIDHAGWIRATPDGGLALAELDLAAARTKSLTELADVMADRRPELYAAVAEPSAAPAPR